MLNIDNKFDIGQCVYLKTDPDQNARIITSIIVNKYDLIYEMIYSTSVSRHYDFEISETKNELVNI